MIMALHRPSPLIPHVSSDFVATLKESASYSVDLYTHYSSRKQVFVNWIHLYQIFLSCTALLFCFCEFKIRVDLMVAPDKEVEARITRCRTLLERFAPGWALAARYQEMFDALVQAFKGEEAVVPANPEVHGGTSAFDVDMGLVGDQMTDDFIASLCQDNSLLGSPSAVMRGFWSEG